MRKAAIAAAVVVLVLIIAAVVVPRLVTLDSLKPRIVEALEEKTGRKIALDHLSLSLLPGIGVKIAGLEVSGDPPHPDQMLLSVPEAEIRVAIGPLFSGRAEFTKLILRRPKIHFHTHRDGTHSMTGIANRLAEREEPAEPAPLPPGKEEKVRVVLRSVNVQEGEISLRFEDKDGRETRWDISPFTFRLSGIGQHRHDFEIRTHIEGAVRGEIEYTGNSVREGGKVVDPTVFDLAGEGQVFGQKMTVEGKMSAPMLATEVDLAISFPKIGMDEIAGILKDPPPALSAARLEGLASLTAKVSGSLQSMGVEVEVDLTKTGWTIREKPEIRKYIDTPCTIVAQGHYFPELVLVSNAELRFPPLLLIANASLNRQTGAREWTASSRIASLAEFGKLRGGGISAWSPAGRLTASGKGKRDRADGKEAYQVSVDLGDVGFAVPERKIELRALEGHVELKPGVVTAKPLAGLFNGQRFFLQGDAALGPKPKGQVDFRMAYLDVDTLFPSKEAGRKEGEKKSPSKEKKGGAPAKGNSKISVRANLSVDAGKARGVEFQNLKGKARYEEGDLILDSVRARMYGGDVRLAGRVGLGGPSPDFQVKVAVENLAAEEILSRKTSLKDFLSGPVSLSADIGGGIKDFDDFARSGAGSGSVKITGGKIKGVDLLATAAGLAGLEAIASAARSEPGTAAKGETRFSDLSADFQLEGGKIRTKSLTILSEKMGLTGKAAIGFDRTIDFQGVLRLSREMSQRVRGKTGKFLAAEDGRVEIPLVMTGPLTSPAVAIDPSALAKGAAGKILRDLTDRISGSESSPGADNAASAEKPEQRKPLEEVEGIFKKFLPGK
jgi:uncharacterized protein involved in outer membrane biogenesis